MKYAISPTPQFERDYRRAAKQGADLGPLNAVIAALAAGETLPAGTRDRPLGGDLFGYRECRVQPDRLLVYRLEGDTLLLHLIRTGAQAELYRQGGKIQMKNGMKSLYRSPIKTAVTLLLLAAAAFLFLYNLGEYSVSDREYREARDKYEGVLTVEEKAVPDNATGFDYFLMTDETFQGNRYDLKYEDNHQSSLSEGLIEQLANLPHVSRVDKRYLTAGVSSAYIRLDTNHSFFPYYARAVLTATVRYRFPAETSGSTVLKKQFPYWHDTEYLTIEDVQLLAGDPAWLLDGVYHHERDRHAVRLQIMEDDSRGEFIEDRYYDYRGIDGYRFCMFTTDNHLYASDVSILQPGHKYLMVLRNNCVEQSIGTTLEYLEEYSDVTGFGQHLFHTGDDSLIGWWPYFVDITDLPENWLATDEFADLRELIRVTNDDVHTFDVVYGDDMAAQRRVAEGRMVCEEGRFITPADAGQPVCVVSTDFLEMSGLKVGDSITLDLGNYLSEQYAPLGAVASTRGRQNTAYTEQTFTIIGTWRDLNEGKQVFRDRFWCWSNNAIFVPSAFLPECRNAEGHEFKPSEIGFIVGNAEEIVPFMEECLPILDEMGLSYVFSDGGWSHVGPDLMQARSIALVKLLVFGGAAVFALVLTVWLFIGRKKREYAICRALGMPRKAASMQLYVPFLVLGVLSAVVGAIAARVFSLRQLTQAQAEAMTETAMHTSAGPGLYILGTLGFLLVLAAFAWGGILLIRRKSVLELLQGEGNRRRERTASPERGGGPQSGGEVTSQSASLTARYAHVPAGPSRAESPLSGEPARTLGGSRSRSWGGRYLRRLLGRNLGRSALSLLLAALLAFAFGLVTVLRGIYAVAYQNIEVKPVISGGLGYDRAVKIAESGYVRDPYYECISQVGQIEMEPTTVVLTNRLDKWVTDPVEWLPGWDENVLAGSDEKVLVMYAAHAKKFGISLGDKVRVNESDWYTNLTAMGLDPLKPGETALERRDARRPFFRVVGIIESNVENETVFISTEARWSVQFLVPKLELDIAEYTLIDYHQAATFTDYVKSQLDRNQSAAKFTMDTSYADRIYKIHRLIESLYPLAVAAALLLGGVLPGLIVLHGSKEISILRALGVPAKDCVILYTLSQVLCALAGLVLGIAAVLVALRPELGEVIVPFAIYLAAHLAACALGSGIFAWLCARKRVLEQLQAKE